MWLREFYQQHIMAIHNGREMQLGQCPHITTWASHSRWENISATVCWHLTTFVVVLQKCCLLTLAVLRLRGKCQSKCTSSLWSFFNVCFCLCKSAGGCLLYSQRPFFPLLTEDWPSIKNSIKTCFLQMQLFWFGMAWKRNSETLWWMESVFLNCSKMMEFVQGRTDKWKCSQCKL